MKKAVKIVAIALWCGASAPAAAQIERGNFQAFLDGALFSWEKQLESAEDSAFPAQSEKAEIETLRSGPFSQGGVGVGFAATAHLIPQLYFSLQNAKLTLEDVPLKVRRFELRPAVEVALLPASRVVPFVMAGLTLGKLVTADFDEGGDFKESAFGLGPALGVGGHAFVVPHASIDLSLIFRSTFFVKSTREMDLGGDVDYQSKQHALFLNLGASFWLGTRSASAD